MHCPNCNAEGASGKFCRSCGSPLTTPKKIVCSGCGTEILSTTKFCAKCGTRVAAVEATGGQNCTKCNALLESQAKFCKSCGQPAGAAPRLAVARPVAAATLAEALRAPALATDIGSLRAPGSGTSAPQLPKPVAVEAFPVEPEPEPIFPSAKGRKPVIWTGGILVMAAVAFVTWWFTFRTPPGNNAPIVKGPLYDQPAR